MSRNYKDREPIKGKVREHCYSEQTIRQVMADENWAYREVKSKHQAFEGHRGATIHRDYFVRSEGMPEHTIPENQFFKVFKPDGKTDYIRIIHPVYEKSALKYVYGEVMAELRCLMGKSIDGSYDRLPKNKREEADILRLKLSNIKLELSA